MTTMKAILRRKIVARYMYFFHCVRYVYRCFVLKIVVTCLVFNKIENKPASRYFIARRKNYRSSI